MLDDIVQREYPHDAELTLVELNAIYYQHIDEGVRDPYTVLRRFCDRLMHSDALGKGYDPRYKTIYHYLLRKMRQWPQRHPAKGG
jgi:hypothetical protein